MTSISIKRALISVSDKTGLIPFAQFLIKQGVELLSTGGTARMLAEAGIKVTDVASYTGFPEMMDGRIKTLHPKVHGGILALRDDTDHQRSMKDHHISEIDLVVINLYPFEESLKKGAAYDDMIENIDIGGPAMIRAAAKNHAFVTVVVDTADYDRVQQAIEQGALDFALRKELAAKAFARTGAYDACISRWFCEHENTSAWPPYLLDARLKQTLRYGENPHQAAALYERLLQPTGVVGAQQLQGKELSYNNIHDADAALALVQEFSEPAVVLVKHANPCGVAVAASLVDAYKDALACDTTSAFGGIMAVNRTLDMATVEAIGSLFLEVIIAPGIEEGAKDILSKKPNLRILITPAAQAAPEWVVKTVAGGYLLQTADSETLREDALQVATERKPNDDELASMRFAFKVCKHVKSNAIVMVHGTRTVGIGAGQMSRVDSVRIACSKAETAGLSVAGAVMASDAFFPFDDNVHHAAKAGIKAIIQPGGSIRDNEVIAAANQHGMAMVFTGLRHFKH